MSFLSDLRQVDLIVNIATHVALLYIALPAYKHTKHRGFIFWGVASLLSLWNTGTLRTLGADPRSNPDWYHFISYSYRITFVVVSVLMITGTVMLVASYRAIFATLQKKLAGADSPPQDLLPRIKEENVKAADTDFSE